MRGGLHIKPDITIGEYPFIIASANVLNLAPDPIGFVICKAKLDGPYQREYVYGQQ